MPAPDWATVFRDPSLPLHLDIGCATGTFAAELAAGHAGTANILGLEIREACLESDVTALSRDLENLHLIYCNAITSLGTLLEGYPGMVAAILVLHRKHAATTKQSAISAHNIP